MKSNKIKLLSAFITSIAILLGCQENNDEQPAQNISVSAENAKTKMDPGEFNNQLMSALDGALNLVNKTLRSDSSNVTANKNELLFEIGINKQKVNKLEFENDGKDFKTAVSGVLDFYETSFKTEFEQVEAIILKGKWSDTENEALVNFDQTFAAKEKELMQKVEDEQMDFSVKYKVQLIDPN